MDRRKRIDVCLGYFMKHFGQPRLPVSLDSLASDVLDGDYDHLCTTLGELVLGENTFTCSVERIQGGGVRGSGVWCCRPRYVPHVYDIPQFKIIIREPYVRHVEFQQTIFDIALVFASLRLWCSHTRHWENRELTHLLAMYCGFAETYAENALYIEPKIRVARRSVEYSGVRFIMSPADAVYALESIRSMRS